ncbi:hypothetical protein AOLI_G00190630 [Acnodon oligacanthus]
MGSNNASVPLPDLSGYLLGLWSPDLLLVIYLPEVLTSNPDWIQLVQIISPLKLDLEGGSPGAEWVTTALGSLRINMGYLNQSCYQDRWCSTILAKCDRALTGSCIFLSTAVELNSTQITFKLYGEFSSYIAVGFSADDQMGGNDTVYACANDNGALKLIHATMLNSSTLTQVNSPTPAFVGGFVIGSMIHCTFTVNDPNCEQLPAKELLHFPLQWKLLQWNTGDPGHQTPHQQLNRAIQSPHSSHFQSYR